MTYEEIVEKLQKTYGEAKADKVEGHVAVQFDITGEGGGSLYVEITDGKIDVQPYQYWDHNARVTLPADVLMEIADGKTDFESAYNDQKLWIDGDLGAALLLKNIEFKKTAKKPAAKKATAKTAEKKPAAKKTACAKKTTAKAAETKTTAEKATAEKTATEKATSTKTTTTKKATTKTTK